MRRRPLSSAVRPHLIAVRHPNDTFAEKMRAFRPGVIVGVLVVGAVVTAGGAWSQLVVVIPAWLLYEIGIVAVEWWQSKR